VWYRPTAAAGKPDPHAGHHPVIRGLLVTLGVLLGALVGGLAGIGLAVAILVLVVATS